MARPRLQIGEHGEVHHRRLDDGRWTARVQVRDSDGRLRQATALGPTKGAAGRALQRRLAARHDPSTTGVTADMTVSELADLWLQHRATHGKARGGGAIAPQTLAGYDSAIRHQIKPTLGEVRLKQLKVSLLDAAFARIESGADGGTARDRTPGRTTGQARTVLKQMLDLAVRHEALIGNPMTIVEPTSRSRSRGQEIQYLTVPAAVHLRRRVRREILRVPDRRMPNHDLQEWVDFVLGTGCRDGEALGVRWLDVDLDAALPTAHICGTVIEPRGKYVESLHRQDVTKSRTDRTLILPDRVVEVLRTRAARDKWTRPEGPVFATATGHWISPANIRARLRKAVADDELLVGTSPHTLRRTVGTLVAHEAGLDAARDQLGHSDASVTFQHYVARRVVAPDLRHILDQFFTSHPCP